MNNLNRVLMFVCLRHASCLVCLGHILDPELAAGEGSVCKAPCTLVKIECEELAIDKSVIIHLNKSDD